MLKWLRKIFSPKKGTSTNTKNEIITEVSFKVLGNEYKMPITQDSIDDLNLKKQNSANPESCEKEPSEDEIKLPLSFFTMSNITYVGDECNFFALYTHAKYRGYNNIVIDKKTYLKAINNISRERRKEYILCRSAHLNQCGIALEKQGRIDEAINSYEENIKLYPTTTHAYYRLMVLYRKKKELTNEIRVIQTAIYVFEKENQRRAYSAIERNPERKEEILVAWKSCNKVMGNNGFYCFVPCDDVLKYKKRLSKLTARNK